VTLSALLSVYMGFRLTFYLGMVMYLAAFVLILPLRRRRPQDEVAQVAATEPELAGAAG
jgi:hypothetical protein